MRLHPDEAGASGQAAAASGLAEHFAATAIGAMAAARGMGIAIPGDVSLVGVDDHEFAAVMGLTTVRQDVVEHGARAAAMLLRRLSGGQPGQVEHETRPAALVVRSTTRPIGPAP